MKKKLIISGLVAGALLISVVSGNGNRTQPPSLKATQSNTANSVTTKKIEAPTCNGISVTSNCTLEGVNYTTYIYHAAVPEKSHDETVTTYKQEVTGYCTLCADGTYSPSCATGRGACSYHGGVAQWNAPIYSNIPQYSTKKIIDAPAQESYYQKAK